MTMITPSYLGETIEYSSLHACRSTLEDPTHIIGPQATELIAEAVAVMELEGTIDELMFVIHAHPTISEAMLDAYAAVEGMAINA